MTELVRLSLSVYADHRPGGFADFELWTRDVLCGFLPAPGDRVPLWTLPDDDGEGELWTVAKRYWWNPSPLRISPVLVLRGMWVDPPEGKRSPEFYDSLGREPWFTESAGDPRALLAANGWSNV